MACHHGFLLLQHRPLLGVEEEVLGQVGGHQGRGGREGQGTPGLGSGLEGAPRGVVHALGVVGDAGVQGAA